LDRGQKIRAQPKSASANADFDYTTKDDYGKVPDYLIDRKIEMAQEAERRRLAQADASSGIPSGMVVMSEDDRIKTLDILKSNMSVVMNELARFSVVVETISQINRKQALEDRLKQIEDAINVFSRKTVYVKAG